jgi:hypothetical protein
VSDDPLRRFVSQTLTDAGAAVSESESFLWAQVSDRLGSELEVPPTFVMTLDPNRVGEFGAELLAPGSYLLEKIVSLAVRRGRWDIARFEAPSGDWIEEALTKCDLGAESWVRREVHDVQASVLFEFSFRVTLVSDEKREHLHQILVSPISASAWKADPVSREAELVPVSEVPFVPETLQAAYRLAAGALRETTQPALDAFRSVTLGLIEEEVRRIFGYFDRTIEEVQRSDPEGSQDLVRAIQGERDRRLTETLERFDPKALARLCSVRAIVLPMARVRLRLPLGPGVEVFVDPWSRHVAGLVCEVCHRGDGPWRPQESGTIRCAGCAATRAEYARPRGRPRSDTPPRGTRVARGSGRSPRGSKARSRAGSGRRRGP